MTEMVGTSVRVGKRSNDQSERNQASAMRAGGAGAAAIGLVGGGIPGAREPDGNKVWLLRGKTKKQRAIDPRLSAEKSPLHRKNVVHNVKTVGSLPRAGILGFRANVHDGAVRDFKNKPPTRDKAELGRRAGWLDAEKRVTRGMRIARRATYPLTIGGAGVAVAGHRRLQEPVGKREVRERGAAAGAGGAALGVTGGAYAGLRYGGDAGLSVVNRNIKREHLASGGAPLGPRQVPTGGDRFVRRMKGVRRGVKGGMAVGAGTLGVGGYQAARGQSVTTAKRDRFEENSAAALGAGSAAAAAGSAVPAGLKRFSRKYNNSAKEHVLAAQKLHPKAGGLKTIPAQHDPIFGSVVRPAKHTSSPEISTKDIDFRGASAKVRHQVGEHRGKATQERYFSGVMDKTGKQFKRLRGPGLAVAAAGGAGLAGSKGKRDLEEKFGKAVTYGYQEKRRNKIRTGYQAGGAALVVGGAATCSSVPGAPRPEVRREPRLRRAGQDRHRHRAPRPQRGAPHLGPGCRRAARPGAGPGHGAGRHPAQVPPAPGHRRRGAAGRKGHSRPR